jgi:hypothetical protein
VAKDPLGNLVKGALEVDANGSGAGTVVLVTIFDGRPIYHLKTHPRLRKFPLLSDIVIRRKIGEITSWNSLAGWRVATPKRCRTYHATPALHATPTPLPHGLRRLPLEPHLLHVCL